MNSAYLIPALLALLLFQPAQHDEQAIIYRHDRPASDYVQFARDLPVTKFVVRVSSTDAAGTLISPQWILSAAHVAQEIPAGYKLILASGDSVTVGKVVIHPGWIESGFPEDIALIKIVEPVEFDSYPALYSRDDENGKKVYLVGNGDTGTGLTGPTSNDGAFRGATNLIDNVTPDFLLWTFDDPTVANSNATEMEGISGPGDSSSPAFILEDGHYFIAGISSGQDTQPSGGKEGRYDVVEYYSRVSTYVEWIEEVIGD